MSDEETEIEAEKWGRAESGAPLTVLTFENTKVNIHKPTVKDAVQPLRLFFSVFVLFKLCVSARLQTEICRL